MKNVILVIAMLMLFSSCATSKFTATVESSTNQELFLSRLHPKPHRTFRGPGKRFSPFPAGHVRPTPFYLPQEVTRCLSEKEDVATCFDDIAMTFFTREVVIGSECCDAIKKMNQDCEKTVFGSFRNPILTGYVKLHCSTVVGSASPPPSLTPSPAPSHVPSQVSSPASSPAPSPLHASSQVPSLAPLQAPSTAPLHASSPAQKF